MRKRSRALAGLLAMAFVLSPWGSALLAKAPEALSIVINGYAFSGKALWYKGKIYVPLEDVARATGGTFEYDEKTGEAAATVGAPAAPTSTEPATVSVRSASPDARPYIAVTWERKYLSGSNAKVMATLSNKGESPAQNLEAICIFKNGTLNEIGAVTRPIGVLMPGESRTVEFSLYDSSVSSSYPAYAYYNGRYYYYPGGAGAFGGADGDKILVDGHWTRIYYELKFNYQ